MLCFSSVQEAIKLFDVKNKFLRRVIPRLRPIGELVRERDEAMKHAENAEATAREAIKREKKILQAENRKLRDENLELTSSTRSKCLYPAAS